MTMTPNTLKTPALPALAIEKTEARPLNLGIQPLPLMLMLLALAALFLLSIALGSVAIPLQDIVAVLTGGEASRESWTNIILKFRLPKAITAALAGAALGMSGLMMQTLFRNPLAGPYVLGISSGASLGVALIVLGMGTAGGSLLLGLGLGSDLLIASAAGMGAALSMGIVLLVARRVESSMTLLILGMMFGYFTSSLVSLLMYFSIAERIQAYINWTFGSFSGVTWGQMPILFGFVALGLLLSFSLSKSLNAMLLGEAYARSLGLNVRRARLLIVIATALLAGVVTAFCGPIGFIGIAVPHICRAILNTSDHRVLVPSVVLMGAIVALIASLIAEMPGSRILLPLNAVTALIGAPVVMWVILRRGNFRKTFAS